MELTTADLNAEYQIRKNRVGRPRKKKVRRAYKNHGESSIWQFKFPKTEENKLIAEIFSVKSKKELEQRFGIKVDDDLEWKKGMKFITENILITIARRGVQSEKDT